MDALLSALRAIRALSVEAPAAFAGAALTTVLAHLRGRGADGVETLTMEHPALEEPVQVAAPGHATAAGAAAPALASSLITSSALFRFHGAGRLDEAEERVAELLCGEVALGVALRAAEGAARRRARQLGLLRALVRLSVEPIGPAELADRAALELMAAFPNLHVAVHLLEGEELVLTARRTVDGAHALADVPPDFRRIRLDDPVSMLAEAVRDRALLTRAVRELGAPVRALLEPPGVEDVLCLPLVSDHEVVGTLSLARYAAAAWSDEESRVLASASDQLAMGLVGARRLAEERKRARDLTELNLLGSIVGHHLDLPFVLRTVVQRLSVIADVPRVSLLLADEARTELRMVACSDEGIPATTFSLDSPSAAAHAFRSGAPVTVTDVESDPRAAKMNPPRHARSVLAVPLVSRGEPIGSLVLVETRRLRRFAQDEVDRLVAVANLVAPAITNAQMFEDLRRSYEALGRAQAELVTHERLAALGELSAVMAHEVRNPVAVIFNSLGALRRVVQPGGDASLLLDIVGEEATRLNRIVGDLLDFVKPYASHPRPSQIDAVVRAAVEAACRAAPSATVRVETQVEAPPEDVILDAYMLQQALINLIVNAIQAMPKGGVVSVRVAEASPSRLRCEVCDEGPGIEPEQAKRIFEPFFTTKASGTGLGLAVVKRIADALEGEVGVSPGAAGGTCFTLVVPLLDPSRVTTDGVRVS